MPELFEPNLEMKKLIDEFEFAVPFLIKTKEEIKMIADAIPETWQNDSEQKTDVAYLFKEVDSEEIIKMLPMREEFIDMKYVGGAIIWNLKRENIHRSGLSKIVGHEAYEYMQILGRE